jgi:maltose O-acetyltransferase
VNLSTLRRRLQTEVVHLLPPFFASKTRTEVFRRLGVVIGEETLIHGELRVTPGCELSLLRIGKCGSITGPLFVDIGAEVTIGDGVCIGHHVFIYTHSHPVGTAAQRCSPVLTCDPVSVGDGTWVASHVVLLPGARIGKGCVVAAGSIVTRSTPPTDDVFLSGNPARILGPVKALAVVG